MKPRIDLEKLTGMESSQLGMFLGALLEKFLEKKPETLWGLIYHAVDQESDEGTSRLIFSFTSKEAALEALKDRMKTSPLPEGTFWDIEEVNEDDEEEDHIGPESQAELDSLRARFGGAEGDPTKVQTVYWEKRRIAYEEAVIEMSRPMTEEEHADWNAAYPFPGVS